MPILRRTFFKVRDIYELAIPCTAFCILFIAFIWQVFTRYILNEPISWPIEIQALGYIWTVLPSACYVRRLNKHVAFTVVYDLLPARFQQVMRIFGNLVIAGTYSILLPYTIQYVFSVTASTPVFRIPLTVVFLPMIFFVFAAVCYALSDIYMDARSIFRGEPPRDPREPVPAPSPTPAPAVAEGGDL